jgi:hypothetical protein
MGYVHLSHPLSVHDADYAFLASYGGPANFTSRLHATASKWTGSGELAFLNDWTYKLGEGMTLRMKYVFLLNVGCRLCQKSSLPLAVSSSMTWVSP